MKDNFIDTPSQKDYSINPPLKGIQLDLVELMRYYELIWVMIKREIAIRYKQTLIGSAWIILQPTITVAIFVIVFNKMMGVAASGIPYVAFALCGIAPWLYFTHAVTRTSYCLIENQSILRKIYFPRLVLPISTSLGGLFDFVVMLLLLIVVLIFYQVPFTIAFLLAPAFLLLVVINALAMGLWLSAFNIKYRDLNNILPFLIQIGLFITPIGYPMDMAPEKLNFIFNLNPLAGAISGFRWAILGTSFPPITTLMFSIVFSVLFLVSGLYIFKKKEDNLVDHL